MTLSSATFLNIAHVCQGETTTSHRQQQNGVGIEEGRSGDNSEGCLEKQRSSLLCEVFFTGLTSN